MLKRVILPLSVFILLATITGDAQTNSRQSKEKPFHKTFVQDSLVEFKSDGVYLAKQKKAPLDVTASFAWVIAFFHSIEGEIFIVATDISQGRCGAGGFQIVTISDDENKTVSVTKKSPLLCQGEFPDVKLETSSNATVLVTIGSLKYDFAAKKWTDLSPKAKK